MLLYHEFDNDYLMLKGLKYAEFKQIQEIIVKERDKEYKEIMTKIDVTNKYCVGKLWVNLFMIEDFPYQDANVSVRIIMEPYTVKSKECTMMTKSFSYDLNQQFLLYG